MDWFTLPAAVLVFLCLKLWLDRLFYGFHRRWPDETFDQDRIRPRQKDFRDC